MNHKLYKFEDFILDPNQRQLLFKRKPIFLTSRDFDILSLLVQHNGTVVDKKEIFDTIWSENFVEENNLPVHISVLRKLFVECGYEGEFIKTVSGRGYIYTVEAKEILPIQSVAFRNSFEKILTPDADCGRRA